MNQLKCSSNVLPFHKTCNKMNKIQQLRKKTDSFKTDDQLVKHAKIKFNIRSSVFCIFFLFIAAIFIDTVIFSAHTYKPQQICLKINEGEK